jgi:predicted permease
VAVLGHAFWQREYGAEAGAVGRTLSLDGHPFQIVGVAPPGFFGVQVGREASVYAPLCAEAVIQGPNSMLDQRSAWWLQIMARPRPEITPEALRARLAALSPGVFTATTPTGWDPKSIASYLKTVLAAQPAATGFSDLRIQYRPALVMLMAVVALVLVIACGNVANLLLARGTVRQRETAMRLALGASRGRLVRQMLTESLLLSLIGAGAGLLFARWSSQLLVRMLASRGNVVWLDLSPDYRLLGFSIGVALVTSLLFGLAPAWRTTRVDPQTALRAHSRGGIEGGRRLTLGKALVLAQVALSLVLVLGAALLLRTFHTLATLDPGFHRDGILAVRMDLSSRGYDTPRLVAVQRAVLERLERLPGVRSAASVAVLPISGMEWNGGVKLPGQTVPDDIRDRLSWYNQVAPNYFNTMGTEFVMGRDFGPGDVAGSVPVAIVTEAMVHKYLREGNPIGRRFIGESGRGETTYEVVGVVRDSRYRSLRDAPEPIVYLPASQGAQPSQAITYVLRTEGPPSTLMPSIRDAVNDVDPRASFSALTVSETLNRSLARERLLATLSGFFGGLALLLALIGQYGLMSYSVARRRNEIGIRLALGAERVGVVRMVLGEVGRLLTLGVAAGLVTALICGRLVATFLYGVTATDPVTLITATGAVIAVGLAAGAIPAWRAARLDPVSALRED